MLGINRVQYSQLHGVKVHKELHLDRVSTISKPFYRNSKQDTNICGTDDQANWRVEEMNSIKINGIDQQHAAKLLLKCAKDRKVISACQFCSMMSMEKQVLSVYNIFFVNDRNL